MGVVSLIPIPQVGPQIPSLDNVFHVLEYFLFGWLLMRAQFSVGREGSPAARMTVVVALLYGAFLEIMQAALPYRDAEGLDILANVAGAVIAAVVAQLPLKDIAHG